MRPRLLHQVLDRSAQRLPEKEALRGGKDSTSYAELARRSRAAAAFLTGDGGLARGERIGLFIEKSATQAAWIFGASEADLPFVVMSEALKEAQVAHIAEDCALGAIVATARTARLVGRQTRVILAEEAEAQGSGLEPRPARSITDDVATIFYTSGSTGKPKGIVVTHRNLLDGIEIVSGYLGIREDDRLLGMLPFNFDYGLNQLTTAIAAGASIVLHQFFAPTPMLRLVAQERISGLAAIPTVWASVFNPKLADLPSLTSELDFSALRYITNSGGKIPVPTVRRIRESFPKARLFLMYGLTEAFRSTYLDPDEVDRRPDSMGKAIPEVEVEVIDPEGRPCASGETGELIHRGALIARGYWNDPIKTAEAYRPNPLLPPEGRFLEKVVYSGDLVRKDDEGFLYYVGRKDGMIKISGFRVSPTEVEELLVGSGMVSEAVAFGIPDEELGYRIKAVVVLKGEGTEREAMEHCKRSAPGYLVPRDIVAVESFPKTASGKIDRPAVIKEHS